MPFSWRKIKDFGLDGSSYRLHLLRPFWKHYLFRIVLSVFISPSYDVTVSMPAMCSGAYCFDGYSLTKFTFAWMIEIHRIRFRIISNTEFGQSYKILVNSKPATWASVTLWTYNQIEALYSHNFSATSVIAFTQLSWNLFIQSDNDLERQKLLWGYNPQTFTKNCRWKLNLSN